MADSTTSAEFCLEVSSFFPRTSLQGGFNKNRKIILRSSVKVFLPMPDEDQAVLELTNGILVPFDPSFLEARADLQERPPPKGWPVSGAVIFDVSSAH